MLGVSIPTALTLRRASSRAASRSRPGKCSSGTAPAPVFVVPRYRARYLGTTKTGAGAVPELHFPGLDLDAARELARRKVNAVGIDTPSIDYGQSSIFAVHRRLFAVNIPAFENVANLGEVPAMGAYVIALPMKIKGGSGGGRRIVALLPEYGRSAFRRAVRHSLLNRCDRARRGLR